MRTFTAEQLHMFLAYEKVRRSGKYNMFSPQAAVAAGLDKEEQLFIIKNFFDLQKQVIEEGLL